MSPEQIEVERKAFEAHVRSRGNWYRGDLDRAEADKYLWNETQRAWECWLARAEKAQRVREALERLSIVAECVKRQADNSGKTPWTDWAGACHDLEKAQVAARAALKD